MRKSSEFWSFFDGEAVSKLALRANTFRKMFEYLDRLDTPINIIETGCARNKDDWSGEGQSTILFDKYVHHHAAESKLYSVDINKSAIDYARTFIGPKTALTRDDSVKYLAKLDSRFPGQRPDRRPGAGSNVRGGRLHQGRTAGPHHEGPAQDRADGS